MTNSSDNPAKPEGFGYRGLVFKIHRSTSLNFWTIKNGNRIVLRYFTLPHKIEADILTAIQSIKDGVDAGRGLNVDYSKVI